MTVTLYRLVLGLILMFCSGWMIHSALMAAKDLVVDYLRYQQQKAKDNPWSWDCPASIRHLEASLLEWLSPQNRVPFASAADAEHAGYRAGKDCLGQ